MPYVIPALITKTGNNEDLYVANNGSGGSAPQTLTSPATVDPDEFNNSTLNLNGSQGTGRLIITSSDLGIGALNFDGVSSYKISNDPLAGHSVLNVGTSTGTNVLSYDSTDQISAFGDSTAVGGPAVLAGPNATLIRRLGGAPSVLVPLGSVPFGSVANPTTVLVPLVGLYEGLWCVVCSANGIGTTQQSRDAQISVICYINSAKQCQMGGSSQCNVGTVANTSNAIIEIFPLNGQTNLQINYTGAQPLTNFGVYAFNISGPIPGTF